MVRWLVNAADSIDDATNDRRYPLGRIVGGTVYPGLMLTSGALLHVQCVGLDTHWFQ
jgi:hypothetical protein